MSWLDADEFAAVVQTAVQAPSMNTTQPWRFRLAPAGIDLLVDPDLRLPVDDAPGRASRLACGAALLNLRLALAVRGRPVVVELRLERTDPHLMARVTPAARRAPTPTELRLYRAIPRRHSNRAPFAATPVPVEARAALIAAASAEDGWLDLLLGPAAVEAAAGLVRTAHAIFHRDAGCRAEASAWTRVTAAAADRAVMAGATVPPRPPEPLVAVLGGAGDWPADQVQSGQAMQRVWLTATDFGLAASLFLQPIEVAGVREQLRLALGRHTAPQMLMRFGYAEPAPSDPRRPVGDVILR